MLPSIVFISLLSIVPNAFAGHSDAFDDSHPGTTLVLCERQLEKKHIQKKEVNLSRDLLGRPFLGWMVHDMTPAALVKMGLDPQSTERDLKDLVLVVERAEINGAKGLGVRLNRYRAGKFENVLEYIFASELKDYQPVYIHKEHWDLVYKELLREYPREASRRDSRIGYHSHPDQDGVRRYIAFEQSPGAGDGVSAYVEFGLDVPCDKVTQFTEDVAEVTDDLRADSGRYRRIAVLHYARVD